MQLEAYHMKLGSKLGRNVGGLLREPQTGMLLHSQSQEPGARGITLMFEKGGREGGTE